MMLTRALVMLAQSCQSLLAHRLPPSCTAGVQRYERHTSYNVLSLRRQSRIEDISSELAGSAVLALQGTRLPHGVQPVETVHARSHVFVSAGYGRKSNKHSGVMLGFSRRAFKEEHIHAVAWPQDECLRGRGLMVRTRR
eukprot:12963119-Alexandrium_andersonii.AAC.1